MASTEEQEVSPEQLGEDFSVWKKNTSFLYDLVVSHPLEWLSLTIHWVLISTPIPCSDDPSSFVIHRLVLYTHIFYDIPNFLMLSDIMLPIGSTKFGVDGKSENSVIPKAHESMVGNVSWNLKNENLFGSVRDDCRLIGWDLRTNQRHAISMPTLSSRKFRQLAPFCVSSWKEISKDDKKAMCSFLKVWHFFCL